MPASSKMDLLVKAKPVNSGSSTSGKTDLRRKLNPVIVARGRSENVESHLSDTQVRQEGRGGDAPGIVAEIPLQPVVQMMVKQLCPCSPWRFMVQQRSTCSPWRSPTPEQVDA
ncbi:hypothetical protein HGM15179_015182 [Zosterops borbonicus]|uniref:Uncharacterized protein n=1 Tax=Zosterops borbonicus TaxID=364589 RepID=A0A8K1G576_9PASS|nr:hypothetical protein HGM15179_015182 [Zosterops borbonicus]